MRTSPLIPFVLAALFAGPASAQAWQLGVSVRSSSLSINQQRAALPLGPVTTPVSASVTACNGSSDAHSTITPQSASAPPTIDFGLSAYGSLFCSSGAVIGTLGLDLVLTATVPGPYWLRVLWDGSNGLYTGGVWTLRTPGGFGWREIRETTFAGHPPYLDLPLDLSQPASLTIDFAGTAVGGCLGFECMSSAAAGRMTFALRATPPMHEEIYGAPCPGRTGYYPAAGAYDPFGVPGLTDIEVGCSNFMNAPLLILCLGSSRDAFGSIPLPLDLTPFGAPGCRLLTDMVVLIPVVSAGYFTTVRLAPEANLRGLGPVYCQWLVPDTVNALGLIFSNGVKLEVP